MVIVGGGGEDVDAGISEGGKCKCKFAEIWDGGQFLATSLGLDTKRVSKSLAVSCPNQLFPLLVRMLLDHPPKI